jgi:ankyrin repeat protein
MQNYHNKAPLHYAAEQNIITAAELLIANGADLNLKNSDGETPLHFAAQHDNFDMVKLLVEKGSQINAKENHGYTVLDIAEMFVRSRRKEFLDFLLQNGAQHGAEHPPGPIDQI